jgi:regulator of protease activity HflC (stomatin/prohibitin superfamily)
MSAELEKMSVPELQANRQYDELARQINAASPEFREMYVELGGLQQLLTPPVGISRKIDLASAAGDAYRARAQFERDTRARETRKAKMAKEVEAEAAAQRIADEKEARAEELKLSAHYRTLWPNMSDSAWADVWPSVRADHYAKEKAVRLEAINKGIGYEQF